MSGAEGYTRRIAAVLLADVSGYSALVSQDDERTARAVRELQAVVRTIVTDLNGYVELRAGDSFFATFDSVVAAVNAGLSILRHLSTEEFIGLRLQVRIGIHFGDVLLFGDASQRAEGRLSEAVGDAINIAARLQALARPGTICVSEGVYRHVRHKLDEQFVDLGRQQLKNISDPVHAYLIVPRELEAGQLPKSRRRALIWAAGTAVALMLAAAGLLLYRQFESRAPQHPGSQVSIEANAGQRVPPAAANAPDESADPVALGVMVFKSHGAADQGDWRREALRDGLNTQLSRLSRVKVYSKEFIDFLITRKGLTEIEAATQLGIRKMLSGSFMATKGALQMEIHVVDVGSGVLETSYTVTGSEESFIALQNKLTMGVISRLDLPVSDEEKQMLLAQQTTDVDALRLLLEAEGGVGVPTPAPPEPRSQVPGVLWWLTGAPALAADAAPAEEGIRSLLEQYRRAMEAREAAALAQLYIEFPPALQAAQQRYFDNVRDLRVTIDTLDIAVVGNEAVVSYTRTDDFTDVRTGRPMHVAVRVTKVLRETQGSWKLTAQ